MDSISRGAEKPHVVCVPFPAQGNLNPMLKVAKLLHFNGFHITFVNSEFNHQRLLKTRGFNAMKGLKDFRFETIPDGLPPSDLSASQDILALCDSVAKTISTSIYDLLIRLKKGSTSPTSYSSSVPPVTSIILDGGAIDSLEAAAKLNIPVVAFWSTSAIGFMGCLQYPKLIEKGIFPLKDENQMKDGYLDTPVDWIEGVKNMRLKDLPSFFQTTDGNDKMFHFTKDVALRTTKASAIILNTFDQLEQKVLHALVPTLPAVYTIGPLSLLLKQNLESPLDFLGSNLLAEEAGCFKWLEGKGPDSVVYVNFGSTTTMTNHQLIEFAWGLANSKLDFLWIKRHDLVKGATAVLPLEFFSETKGRGFVASWCHQEQVLTHPSVGVFLTHSGWNSTIESISGGVPVICWPFFADQQTNCRQACTEWGIGMEIDNEVKRDEVEGLIREMMEGEKGKKMRSKALEWKRGAIAATQPRGTSYENFNRLINEVVAPGGYNV